ncbi:MAG TPA: shikimate kinase [bacterium]|nr:shikimate kinase [bacterium]
MKHLRVILTGFMGTGKTAVGEKLAKRLGFQFLDTDLMVEAETGKSITDIFEKEGEPAFRGYEKKMVRKAMDLEKVVIATGGGAIVDPDNLKLMKEKGIVIGLSASPEAILQRVASMETRPLLRSKDQLKKIESLLSHRSPYYRQADKIVDTTMKRLDETVDEILTVLNANHRR